MTSQMKTVVALAAIFAMFAVSFAGFVPMAHADTGGNQIRVSGFALSGSSVIVTVTGTTQVMTVRTIEFDITVYFSGTDKMNINHVGDLWYSAPSYAAVSGGSATASISFLGPGGSGWYLIVVTGYDADTGTFLGSDWVDPQGTAG